ncbi:MAG: lipoate--protein ligase family protein [Chlamydiota bacterium]
MDFHIIYLKNVPIFEQLLLEEQLLRKKEGNFCLFNVGSSPAAVMGISGKPHELLDSEKIKEKKLPVIKRFSGGGTVLIDENTLFVSFICNKSAFSFPSYPERIMQWSETVYKNSFNLEGFALRENDFVLENLKCGGNAQYITKDRWIQHTSFLWDFCPKNMECLLHPPKTPPYRQGRSHKDFLCTLKNHFSSKESLFQKITDYLQQEFTVHLLEDLESLAFSEEGRISSCYIDLS